MLGGRFDLPHAATHAVVLSYVLALNAGAAPDSAAKISGTLAAAEAGAGLNALYSVQEAPRTLRDLGLEESALNEAADLNLPHVPDSNPAHVTRGNLSDPPARCSVRYPGYLGGGTRTVRAGRTFRSTTPPMPHGQALRGGDPPVMAPWSGPRACYAQLPS